MKEANTEKITELSKRRGFFFQTAKPYGGVAGFYTFGPEGAELKRNLENSWRETFSIKEGHREIEAPTIMPEPVFKASGHLDGFDDMIIQCPECGENTRADHLVEENTDIEEAEGYPTEKIEEIIKENNLMCPICDAELSNTEVDNFNLMFSTNIGPGDSQRGYLRPETAQGIFVEFPRLKDYARRQLPFAITQIGKAYRNEISPRKGLVRVREFTQAELEHFIDPKEDEPRLKKVEDVKLKLYPIEKQGSEEYLNLTVREAVEEDIINSKWIAYYLGIAKKWYRKIGVDMDRFRFRQHNPGERAHYASDCWDAEAEINGDWVEIAGFAYRGNYDLSKHSEYSEEDFSIFKEYDEPKITEKTVVEPDMSYIGPKYGENAGAIEDRLEELAEKNPELFNNQENIEIELENEKLEIPIEKTGFKHKQVKENGEKIIPHVVEPSFGVGRTVYTVLVHSYQEDTIEGEERTLMQFSPEISPTEVAVVPLMDKEGLGDRAMKIAQRLRNQGFSVKYDDTGNIGKRYRRQDEVGTPVCVTIDYDTLDDGTVTLRDRDSTKQTRVEIQDLKDKLANFLDGEDISEL